MLKKGQEASGRAKRFSIHVPIRYRVPHSRDWFEACTENVSRSGVLFRTDSIFEPMTTLDLKLELPPVKNNGGTHAEIVCKGEVVRVERHYTVGDSPAIAVAIYNYRLTKKREPN